MKPTVSSELWLKRIQASRQLREQNEQLWGLYARLHTNAYKAIQEANDDKMVLLPSGDQVKAGLVYRNIEQTLALLDVPEVSISATAKDFTRELDREDSHREAIVSQACTDSLTCSGLLDAHEEADDIKRDAVIIGHGINFSSWRTETVEVDGPAVAVMQEIDGVFEPVFGDNGEQLFEPQKITNTIFDGVEDRRVAPNRFLFSSAAMKIPLAPWHGYEDVVDLKSLRDDPQYDIPEWVQPGAFRLKDIYGDEPNSEEHKEADSVKVITVFDKTNRELITFIEDHLGVEQKNRGRAARPQAQLIPVRVSQFPVTFDQPEDSPFQVFIPIPSDSPFGISQIEHVRNPAVEVDKLKTRVTNLTRQIKRIIAYDKGSGLDLDQIEEAVKKPDFAFLGVNKPEAVKNLAELFSELPMPRVHPELFREISEGEETVRQNTGVSEIPFGGADTATESDNMMAVGGARINRKRRRYLSFLVNVSRIHKSFLARFAAPGQSIEVPGADGAPILLEYGRDVFQGRFTFEVHPGGEQHISPVRQKMLIEASQMVGGRFGQEFDLMWLRMMLTTFNVRGVNPLMMAAQRGLMGGAAPGMGGAAGPQRPEINVNDYTNGQAIRSAINAPNEG
ncbi:MAG: hypothetical protein RPU59_13965 [Candidatus Sedimenticola sp. (ex Thyasira tokunagai)]